MPNYCHNRLAIYGDKKQISELKKKAVEKSDRKIGRKKNPFSIAKLFPCPKELAKTQSPNTVNAKAMIKKYGYPDWYKWCTVNWGTKWDTFDTEFLSTECDKETLKYDFNTAWCPPVQAITEISKSYPDLSFVLKYDEEGMAFMGVATIENGKCDDKEVQY